MSVQALLDPATPAGFAYVWLRSQADRLEVRSDRGASAIEWVIITAVLVAIAGGIGAIIYQLINDAASDIEIPDAPG